MATTLILNDSPTAGNLLTTIQTDIYNFTIVTPGPYVVTFIPVTYNKYPSMTLTGPDDFYLNTSYATMRATLAAGAYTLSVHSSGSGLGTYTIQVADVPDGDELTLNGTDFSDSIDQKLESKYYHFTTPAGLGGTVSMVFTGGTWAGPTINTIYGPGSENKA